MRKTNKRSRVNNSSIFKQENDADKVLPTENAVFKTKKEKKIKFQLLLTRLEKAVVLKENQLEYSKKIENNTITFATGPAGSSKTFSACYTLLKLLFQERIKKIIFTKPIKESGENLGFLPGDVNSKLEPYMESFFYTCKEMIGDETLEFLVENGLIEVRPLAYMRGTTFNDCGMFLDESQNSEFAQLILYITRLGNNSKMVISGDVTQSDIDKKKVVLHEFISIYRDLTGIAIHEFTRADIVRNKLLIEITDRYEKWKELKSIK